MSTYMDNQKGYVLDRTHISRLVYIYIYVEETNSVFWYECEASRLVPNQNVNISRNITIKNAEQEKPKKSPCWIQGVRNWYEIDNEIDIEPDTICFEKSILGGRLKLSSKTIWGKNSKGMRKYTFIPHLRGYPRYCVASSHNPSKNDMYVRVEIQKWNENETMPMGILVEDIGSVNDPSCFEKVLRFGYCTLPRSRTKIHRSWNKLLLSDENIQLKKDESIQVPAEEDWTKYDTFSIDPEGCKDVDDALSYNKETNELAIHIASPTETFNDGTQSIELHNVAKHQSETIYHSTICNLLPNKLVEKHSLLEKEERDCLSVIFGLNGNIRLVKSKVCVNENLTYENSSDRVNDISEGISTIFNIEKHLLSDIHELVSLCMIKANAYVANWLIKNRGDKSILRVAEKGERAWYMFYDKSKDMSHNSLELKEYTHFTSPLRRFADQLVHRSILYDYHATHLELMFVNRSKFLRGHMDTEYYLTKLFKLEEKSENTDVISLKGTIIDMNSHYGRIQLNDKVLSIPIVSNIIVDYFNIEIVNEKIRIEYIPNPTMYFECNIGDECICNLKWNSVEGLEGFLYEWVQPPIQNWVRELIK